MRLPQLVADHHHRRCAFPRVVGAEHAPERRPECHHLEKARHDLEALEAERFVIAQQCAAKPSVCRQVQRLLARLEVDVVAERDELLGDAGPAIPVLQDHQLTGIRYRKRPKQDRLGDREEGGVGANAEAQGQYRRCREPGFEAEQPKGAAEVLRHHGAIVLSQA